MINFTTKMIDQIINIINSDLKFSEGLTKMAENEQKVYVSYEEYIDLDQNYKRITEKLLKNDIFYKTKYKNKECFKLNLFLDNDKNYTMSLIVYESKGMILRFYLKNV